MEAFWLGNLGLMLTHLVLVCDEDVVAILQKDNIHLAAVYL